MEPPQLDRCLAYVVVSDYGKWLGRPSPWDLKLLLAGARLRAELLAVDIPAWRIFGPLEEPEFYLPLVARTGHPTLTIKWATALELSWFDLEGAMRELQRLLEHWVESPGQLGAGSLLSDAGIGPSTDLVAILRSLARRPALYLGWDSGWGLRCFLHGMLRGGDWLSLPPLPSLERIVRRIEGESTESYGSPFAAYRVYESDVKALLALAGIEPAGEAP